MIRDWIAYSLPVGILIGAAALGAEGICRLAMRPTRWVWVGAIALTIVLTGLAPGREDPVAPSGAVPEHYATVSRPEANAPGHLVAALQVLRLAVGRPVQDAVAAVRQGIPGRLDRWLAALWVSLSALLFLLFSVVYVRFRRACGTWPAAELQGLRVRVAPDTGPAVVGLGRPEIVVPHWLFGRTAEEQRLVLAHEREHVRARDPLVLAIGCVTAALFPWHPAIWWMLSRLRLSVELDCDRRVLRRGVAPRSYGALLIDLAGHCSGFPRGMLALADRSSHLERRLLAMTTQRSRFLPLRGGALAALTAVSILAACEARLPTAGEVARMDVAAAEGRARSAALVAPGDSQAVYLIDGVQVSADTAHALAPERIAGIEVRRSTAPGAPAEVRISTRSAAGGRGAPAMSGRVAMRGRSASAATSDTTAAAHALLPTDDRVAPLIFIDGVRSDPAAMRGLQRDDIQSVEVIKGGRAAQLYPELQAANGVIHITTRRGAAVKERD
ncbi:MAG: M56 family metallopeptidase [Gemmatimonadaceae bacterium]